MSKEIRKINFREKSLCKGICQECKHNHYDCPFEKLARNIRDHYEAIGEYECHSFEQKPPPPPPMTAEQFAEKEKELLQGIPEEFHSRLSYMAYEDGHHAGYEEVLSHLSGLVSDLKEPIAAFQKRLTGV